MMGSTTLLLLKAVAGRFVLTHTILSQTETAATLGCVSFWSVHLILTSRGVKGAPRAALSVAHSD